MGSNPFIPTIITKLHGNLLPTFKSLGTILWTCYGLYYWQLVVKPMDSRPITIMNFEGAIRYATRSH